MVAGTDLNVVVTVCTRRRPQSLAECLRSLVAQELPPNVSYALVIVENDDLPRSRELVQALTGRFASATYVHEPRLGIPYARNRALSLALELSPDWIGFIDDDEVADRHWIANFVAAAGSISCDVLQGPVEYRYTGSTPPEVDLPTRKRQPSGRTLRHAATSNTFMRVHIAHPKGLGLRFNEAMRFTGGSDSEFFFRAADQGARICWMDEAVVYESIPENRVTLRWQRERAFRVAANSVTIQKDQRGAIATVARCGPKYLARLLRGALVAPVAAALTLVGAAPGRRMLASALRNISSGLGGLGAFFDFQPEPYRAVDNAEPHALLGQALSSFRVDARLDEKL